MMEGGTDSPFSRRFKTMKRSVVVLGLLLSSAAMMASAADSTKINGWISDSMCGAKHAGSGAACVKKCIEGGMAPVFVDEDKKAVWTIENPDAVKNFYGDHVVIKATANTEKHVMKVEAISIKQ
jgi:hypothetical protein